MEAASFSISARRNGASREESESGKGAGEHAPKFAS